MGVIVEFFFFFFCMFVQVLLATYSHGNGLKRCEGKIIGLHGKNMGGGHGEFRPRRFELWVEEEREWIRDRMWPEVIRRRSHVII